MLIRNALVGGLFLILTAWAMGDDGILYYYGAPKLMHGESSIRMVSEVVTAKVYRDHIDVHCRFKFHNVGAATLARIGFPDGNFPGPEGDDPPKPNLKNFRSKVDGQTSPLTIEIGKLTDEGPYLFHVKTVRFGKGQTHIIEDSYRTGMSGGATNSVVTNRHGDLENLYVSQFTYIMASGGSWHGNIGDATMLVEFMERKFHNLRLVGQQEFGEPSESGKLATLALNRVIWSGFARPSAFKNRVTFSRHNFKPTKKDDVTLTFDWLRYDDGIYGGQH